MIYYPYLCLRIQINHRLYRIRIRGCTFLRCRCTVVHGAFIYRHDFSLFYFYDFTFHINSVTHVHLNALLMHHALTCCNALVQPSFHLCFIWILGCRPILDLRVTLMPFKDCEKWKSCQCSYNFYKYLICIYRCCVFNILCERSKQYGF